MEISDKLRWSVVSSESIFDQLKLDLGEGHRLTRCPLENLQATYGKTDAVLVELNSGGAGFNFQAAAELGLPVPFFMKSGTDGQFLGVCRFGTHKAVLAALAGVGEWWELKAGRAQPYEVFRKLLNRVSDGIAELDSEDRIRWVNTSLKQAVPDLEWEGARLQDMVRDEDHVRLLALRDQHATGVVLPIAVHLPQGEQVELDPSPWFSPSGDLVGTSLVFRQVRKTDDQESRSKELFCLYSLAASMGQASNVEEALATSAQRASDLLELPGGGASLDIDERSVSQHFQGERLGEPVLNYFSRLRATFPPGKRALVERSLPSDHPLYGSDIRGFAAIPLEFGEQRVGLLWFVAKEEGRFARETVSLLISIANQLSAIVENLHFAEQRLASEADKKRFYKDALCAVTGGKLVLGESAELDATWESAGVSKGEVEISEKADVPRSRAFVEKAMSGEGVSDEKIHDAALCATEAVGNVVKHAENGQLAVKVTDETITIRIADQGGGIDFAHLPSAVLAAGFSTAPSLGMGYSILLELMDRVHLATSPAGTILLLEIQKQEADPLAAFAHLMDGDF